jgi:hypothetical protein
MSGGLHEQYRQLIWKERVEGLSAAERELLDRHLEGCEECGLELAATGRLLGELRAIPVEVPPGLAARAEARVYLRESERKRREGAGWALWLAFAFSWVLGVASSPWIWKGFEWLGHWAGAPVLLVKMSFALWWAVPAMLTAAVLLFERNNQGEALWRDFSNR